MEFGWASSLTALFPFLLFVSIFLKSQTISKSAKNYSHIPGPKKLPLIGNLHLMLQTSAPHHKFRDLAAKYGPLLHLQLGELHFLIISSLEFAKQLLTAHDINFVNRPPNLTSEIVGFNYSDLGFAPYGDYFRYVKKIFTLEVLSVKRVRSFRPIREEENKNLVKWIGSCEGSLINLSERVRMFSYDVITRISVGGKTRDRQRVISIIQESNRLAAGFSVADLYPSMRWLAWITGIRYKLQRMRSQIDMVFGGIVDEHRGDKDGDKLEDLVDVLLKSQEDGSEHPVTDDNIKGLLLSIFLAGSDTTSTVVEWAMSHMIKSPSVMKKAQDEIRKVFDGEKGGYVDEEKFDELEYLKLVIKETLRLHPPVPLLVPRINHQKCEVNGFEVPAKTRVMINVWALGRDPMYWGDDVEEFIPERFSDKEMDYKGNNFEYLPFGSGRRVCPGISFGIVSVQCTLATLLYHFDWQMPKGSSIEDLDMTEEIGVAVGRKHPLQLIPTITRHLNE